MEWTVAIGVDTHRARHVAVALDPFGRRLGSLAFPVDERGFVELKRFATSLWEPAFVVEGTGSYDRGKSKREAIRIVKRALARRLYGTLTAEPA